MGNIKKFIGEYAYKHIKNMAYSPEAFRNALLTPTNARAVFSGLSEYEVKSLVAEICNSKTIGVVRNTTKEEIVEAFRKGGYTTVIFDDKQAIEECAKYYRSDETICTYNNLERRMARYHMIVAIKGNIDEIKRSDSPEREDEYGTSIINIQIAKNGSHMSIKNRYNHTVNQCDSTFDNDLNHITMGLQSMVLGYYGFAGITKINSNHYDNIVNIGGIYLKYHIERNNIYFGNFVLDGVNGARFTDSSQYYVTGGTRKCVPMVLDFKNKVAIDLIDGGFNKKNPLVSRAMREGILNSGNKECAENICATFPEAKKELLQTNKNALKYLAEYYGYDFQKPHKVVGILGKFTANSVEKAIENSKALLLIIYDDEMKAVRLNHGSFEINKIASRCSYEISKFYYKCSFEEKRKSGKCAVYVIQQDEKYIRKMKYYDKLTKDQQNECEIARLPLKNRLEIYKANKRKAEAQTMDYSADIKKIDNEFTLLKAEAVKRLKFAKEYKDYSLVSDVSFELIWLIRDIEKLRNNATEKKFNSIKEAQNLINKIYTVISKIWKMFNPDPDPENIDS